MPNKLENLEVHEVSGVDRAANQRTFVLMKAEAPPTKKENGEDFPAEAFAYVPDPKTPSTWKLRLWETLDKGMTAAQVGRAIAALGEGFRGNKVEIPDDALPKVIQRVRSAWKQVNPDKADDDMPEVIKPTRTFKADGIFAKSLAAARKAFGQLLGGTVPDDYEPAKDFATALAERKIEEAEWERRSAIWELTSALNCSIESILEDPAIADKRSAVVLSLQQFLAVLGEKGLLSGDLLVKAGRAMSAERMAVVEQIKELVEGLIASVTPKQPEGTTPPGMTDDEEGEAGSPPGKTKPKPEQPAKTAKEDNVSGTTTTPATVEKAETVAISKADYEALQKQAKEAGERAAEAEKLAKAERDARQEAEYVAKAAKDYASVPMAPADLGKLLKALHDKAPEEAAQIEGLLKSASEAIAKGNLFAEVGTSGTPAAGNAWGKIEALAKAKVEKKEASSMADAIAKVADENPNLYSEYQAEKRAR